MPSAELDERIKGFFVLVLFVFAIGGIWAFSQFVIGWLSPSDAEYMSAGQLRFWTVIVIASALMSIVFLVMTGSLYMSLRIATVAKYAEKRGIEDYTEDQYMHEAPEKEEVRPVEYAITYPDRTTRFEKHYMNAESAMIYYSGLSLQDHQIKNLMKDHKGWEPIEKYLEQRLIELHNRNQMAIPSRPKLGEQIDFPLLPS